MRPWALASAASCVLVSACFPVFVPPPPPRTVVVTTAPSATSETHGTLVRVSGSRLQLAEGGAGYMLDTSTSTLITLNGAPASLSALHPGADIRASFVVENGHAVAIRVDAVGQP